MRASQTRCITSMSTDKKLVLAFAVLTVINVGAVVINVTSNMAPNNHQKQVIAQGNHLEHPQRSMQITNKKKVWHI